MKPDYSYQAALIEETYSALQKHKKVVLAACPGAGKTVMAAEIISQYRKANPKGNILILTHGQTFLKHQWDKQIRALAQELHHCLLEHKDEKLFYKKDRVIIGLPQSYKLLFKVIDSIDLLVVDEAHHFYFGQTIQTIIQTLKPKHQLLLTGTPSEFIESNQWKIVSITIQELLSRNVLSDPHIELVESKYDLKKSSYNESLNLKSGTELSFSETANTLGFVLKKMLEKLSSDFREEPTFHDWNQDRKWREILKKIQKTMIICHSQKQAQDVHAYFMTKGIRSLISISDVSEGNIELDQFRSDPTQNVLVVVNRGVLGFDYDRLINLIDLSSTLNPNRLFQMLCRVVRLNRHDPSRKKLFIKVTNNRLAHVSHFVMSFVTAMSHEKFYLYKKDEFRTLKVPVDSNFEPSILAAATRKNDNKDDDEDPYVFPDLPSVFTFEKIKQINQAGDIGTYSYTTFKEVLHRLSRETLMTNTINFKTCVELMELFETRYQYRKTYRNHYEWMIRNGHLTILDSKWPTENKYSLEKALSLAQNYKTKSAFREAHHGYFRWLKAQGKLDLLPFVDRKKRWDLKSAWKTAKKYQSRNQLRKYFPGCLEFLDREGQKHELNAYYDKYRPQQIQWSHEKVFKVAAQSRNVRDFREKFPGADNYVRTHKLLAERNKYIGRSVG